MCTFVSQVSNGYIYCYFFFYYYYFFFIEPLQANIALSFYLLSYATMPLCLEVLMMRQSLSLYFYVYIIIYGR